jgi:hypothetical protein
VFAISLQDIDKALAPKKTIDPRTKLPQHYQEFLPLFSTKELDKLLLLQGKGVNHLIKLERDKQGVGKTIP